MERLIYHGSESIINKPQHLKGNVHNDYGLGFYCSSNKTLAKEWAARKGGIGFINSYTIRDDGLKILDLTKPPLNDVLYWVALLIHNREISIDLKNNYLFNRFQNECISENEYYQIERELENLIPVLEEKKEQKKSYAPK